MLVSKIINQFFKLQERETSVGREVIAGLTTFLTMVYAFLLVPTLIAKTGIDLSAAVTATVMIAIFGTLLMGLFANYPIGIMPGIAVAVYVAYGLPSKGAISWEIILALTLGVGVALLILNVLRIRAMIIQTIPKALRLCTTGGLGLFLAMIGLKNAGVLVTTGGSFAMGELMAFPPLMVLVAILVTVVLMRFQIPGSFFIGVVVVWAIAGAMGEIKMDQVVSWPDSLAPTFLKLDFVGMFDLRYLSPFISILLIVLFDSTGTVIALIGRCGLIEERGAHCHIPGIVKIFCCDSTSSIFAGLLGTIPTANYLESAAGIAAGGRTGLTSVVTALCFVLMLFFTPLILSIPLYATSGVLIMIGGSMVGQIVHLTWKDPTDWLPGFCTLLLIPLTLNVGLGIGVGYVGYLALKMVTLRFREIHWFSWVMGLLFLGWLVFLIG